jgi:phosphoenolpyruvate synthase/pyruvate phosphate dikinase
MGDTNALVPVTYTYSKKVSSIGVHHFIHGFWGGRLTKVGPFHLSYDLFSKDKVTKIGDHALSYGLQGRLNKVGNDLELHYDTLGGRLNAIGDCKLHYGIKGRLNQIGDYRLEHGYWGRLNGIHMLGDSLTDEKLLIFFIAIHYLEKEDHKQAEQAERERQAKLILRGKTKVKV